MSLDDDTFTFGRGRRPAGDYGSTANAAALSRQLSRLAEVEAWPIYGELLEEANARRRAEAALPRGGNGVVTLSPERTHGLVSTYAAGCKCDDCMRASADYRRRMRAKARPA